MKKKFKRLVKSKTAAKNKGCRIMSALLAASVFVSGGVFDTLAKSGFTVAEDDEYEYVSAQEDIYDDSFGEIPFESDVNFLSAAGNDKIRINPVNVPNNPVAFENWQTNIYKEDNPYVLKSDSSFTLCGTMSDVTVHKTGDDCTDACSSWTKTTNGYCIERDSGFWFTPNNTDENIKSAPVQGDITHEAVLVDILGDDGKPTGEKVPTGEVRVYVTYKAGTVTKDSMYNGIITLITVFIG